MFVILCKYKGGSVEEVDSFDNEHEACWMLKQYRINYGQDFTLWIEEYDQ